MCRLIIGVGILVILIVVVGLLTASFIDVNHYRPQIESKLRDRLDRQVSLGPMHLSWIPLGFQAQNAIISDDLEIQYKPAICSSSNVVRRHALHGAGRGAEYTPYI